MRKQLMGVVVVGFALATAAAAQNPPAGQNPPAAAASQDQSKAITVEGCLLREADVPGRKPNVAERAGVTEDYILTSTKMVKGSAPAGSAGADRPTGTAGTSAMYEVEGIDGSTLKKHVNQRVQIDGVFNHVERASQPAGTNDLVELRGVAIRQVSGDCPAK